MNGTRRNTSQEPFFPDKSHRTKYAHFWFIFICTAIMCVRERARVEVIRWVATWTIRTAGSNISNNHRKIHTARSGAFKTHSTCVGIYAKNGSHNALTEIQSNEIPTDKPNEVQHNASNGSLSSPHYTRCRVIVLLLMFPFEANTIVYCLLLETNEIIN